MKLRRYETMKHMMHEAHVQERSLNAGMHTGSENHVQSMELEGRANILQVLYVHYAVYEGTYSTLLSNCAVF